MELLKLSKFRLHLRILVNEVRELREREHSATDQLNRLVEKQKQTEEEFTRKLTELQAELSSSNELRHKLERQVSYLQNDNALLENKQKELKASINCFLLSRENFVKAFEDSTCEMKRSIQTRDRKVAILSEKINAHLLLFDSIEKEAFYVKQVLDNVQRLVREKEEIEAGLRRKMDKVCAYEKVFIEKISDLESNLRRDENELRRKERIILELEGRLEDTKISSNCQQQIEDLQETLSAKDMVIQNLLSDKKALHLELRSLAIILKKIQDAVKNMNEEDRKAFSSVFGGQKVHSEIKGRENGRIEDMCQNIEENFPCEACEGDTAENTASLCQEHDLVNCPSQGNTNLDSCISEPSSLEHHSPANVPRISATEVKENDTASVYHQDSEASDNPERSISLLSDA
ncbi:uncharacterized protein LOC127789018 isoform X2 [Diospyros lotus]|uniref:uncharacterized protein LOC127789018 isoform X2 n=1 Tax=Diospyros lotus TaxID=55363 RepID=UPI002259D3C1|nr:uncharacterized protein LOC127789018 isoform X2 [Diospyros lotus]